MDYFQPFLCVLKDVANVDFIFLGTESSIYTTGVDMVTASLLPSHSDVQLSCLTGERIKVIHTNLVQLFIRSPRGKLLMEVLRAGNTRGCRLLLVTPPLDSMYEC